MERWRFYTDAHTPRGKERTYHKAIFEGSREDAAKRLRNICAATFSPYVVHGYEPVDAVDAVDAADADALISGDCIGVEIAKPNK